jgi:hypothetical protein
VPKLEGFPKVSLRKSLDLADVVHSLGSSCTSLSCAQKLNVTLSGGFNTKVSACVKFGLLTHKKGQLSITPLYSKIKFSKTQEVRNDYLSQAFFSIELYKNVIFELKKQRFMSKDGINSYLSENELIHVSKIEMVSSNIMDDIKFLHLMESSDVVNGPSKRDETVADLQSESLGKELEHIRGLDDAIRSPINDRFETKQPMLRDALEANKDESIVNGAKLNSFSNSATQQETPKKSAFWSAKLVKKESVGDDVYVHIKGKGIHFEGNLNHASDVAMLEGMLAYLKRRL